MFRLMDQCWSDPDWCSWLELVFACLSEDLPIGFPVTLQDLWICWLGLVENGILQLPNPKDREREFRPCVNPRQERKVQLLLICVRPRSVSCTSNFLAQTCDSQKLTELLQMLILSLRDLLQNQNLEITKFNLLCCVSHMTILPVFTCMMNV